MLNTKHIVVVSGEESGDQHASELIKDFKTKYPAAHFSGIGGRHMKNAGCELIYDLASHGVTGFSEVFMHLRILKKALTTIKQHIKKHKPDLLILVDCPSFNLRVAKYAKRSLGLRILYYISPQIWAWKAGRIHLIRECIDRMAVIFPFEKTIYEKAGVPVNFVGHPLVDKVKPSNESVDSLISELGLPIGKKIIALLPGSRSHEIQRHMPVLNKTIQQLTNTYDNLHFVIPVAGTVNPLKITSCLSPENAQRVTLIKGRAIDVVSCSHFVIVASGTASLECALLEKPMCIIYKSSFLTYLAASRLIKVQYLGLCNLLSNRMIVPELLQYDLNTSELSQLAEHFLNEHQARFAIVERLKYLKHSLSSSNADCTLLQLVENELNLT